jgi:hypothetical protein
MFCFLAQNQHVYDSPPRNGNTESSDYGTIGSGSCVNNNFTYYDSPKKEISENACNKNAATSSSQLGLIRRASLERRFQLYQLKQQQIQRAVHQGQGNPIRQMPTAPPVSQTSNQTRLPQLSFGNSEKSGSGSGASLRRTGAILVSYV